mmetsp:Transcript_16074/g.39539  ORF Transcript_16074/g.39539 Transcript_16074/m.39539 type:complete len:300 (-) Transcript_16074:195-1094(-)
MRGDGAGLAQHLSALHLVALEAAQQKPAIIPRLTLIQIFLEHLHTRHGRALRGRDTNQLHVLPAFHNSLFDSPGGNRSAPLNAEDVLHWHREGLVQRAHGRRDEVVDRLHQRQDRVLSDLILGSLERVKRASPYNRNIVSWKLIEGEELAQLHLYQVDELVVVHRVHLIQEAHQVWDPHLAAEQDVLARLWHGAISSRHHQDSAVHLRCARDHVLDVVSMARTVHVRVVTLGRLVLDVRGADGDTTRLLLGCLVDLIERHCSCTALLGEHLGDGGRQGSFAMVNVADCANVKVLLGPRV